MTLRRRLGAVLLPLAVAALDAGPASGVSLRLLAPVPGAELQAGSLATVEWTGAPAGAEEWEAFLSVDGGRTYPLRITPHLDLSLRRFAFRVPRIPTRTARVMLRFGDERRETGFEFPDQFAIVTGGDAWWPPPSRALMRGERPRPREAGVVVWVEGARDGRGLREVAAAAPSSLRSVEPGRLPWMPLLGPTRVRIGLAAPSLPAKALVASAGHSAVCPGGQPPERAAVRLLIHRFNE